MRSDNLVPLTLEEHGELGKSMKQSAADLRQLCRMVVSVYGPQSRAGWSFLKALDAMDHLNQELQTQAIHDLKGTVTGGLYV